MVHRYPPQPGPFSHNPAPPAGPNHAWQPHPSQQHAPWQQQQPHPSQQHAPWQQQQQQPGNGVPSDEKTSGAVAHLGALLMPIVLPILMFFTGTNKPFQKVVALQAAIVQISTMVLSIVGTIASFALVFGTIRSGGGMMWIYAYLIPMLVMLLGLGMAIMGAVKASQGELWYAPVIGRWLARRCRAEWP